MLCNDRNRIVETESLNTQPRFFLSQSNDWSRPQQGTGIPPTAEMQVTGLSTGGRTESVLSGIHRIAESVSLEKAWVHVLCINRRDRMSRYRQDIPHPQMEGLQPSSSARVYRSVSDSSLEKRHAALDPAPVFRQANFNSRLAISS